MPNFKDHKVSVNELLGFIPEALLSHLSTNTKVDHYSKVLHGKKVFYLLLYAILDNEKLSQRTLEDTFNYSGFKTIFNLDESETVRRSSISERLSKIDSGYFKEIFEYMYNRFSESYSQPERDKYNLIRVDSTIVSEAAGKLKEGIDMKTGKKNIKFSISFDGILPAGVEIFNTQSYSSEENALPEAILKQVKKDTGHRNIYIIDRGLQSTRVMKDFSQKNVKFVIRSKENRKHQEIESLIKEEQDLDLGDNLLIKDSIVNFYTGIPVNNKRGKIHYREEKIENKFRLVMVKNKEHPEKIFWFITNDFELTAKEAADYYRRRWDIEVFFRFIKQELNVSHLVSLSKNGIEVMVYMTLIVAMLLLIYKKANNLGYKTAKRRFGMELRELITAVMIILSGGDPQKVYKT
ncbi:transposase, IS4 family [Flavobacterium sp. CF108]|uniref:IS4 family transposase n=1 Tax=unclassified Flavobacterium TaxID=196869 RepID=UPI0008AC66BF|nr:MULTISPECIES: IS4 family transposase [unclassified Flavobacterium]SEO96361.1 Transposase DDE domain-containing protein [Flavobacterium sp. fv08]SHH81467.1 transposase, IS4 family [Flavobacterium sp. CF108]